jgi:hypothetical protein
VGNIDSLPIPVFNDFQAQTVTIYWCGKIWTLHVIGYDDDDDNNNNNRLKGRNNNNMETERDLYSATNIIHILTYLLHGA